MTNTQERLKKIIKEIEDTEMHVHPQMKPSAQNLSTGEVVDILLCGNEYPNNHKANTASQHEEVPQFWFDMQEIQCWKEKNNDYYSIPYYRTIDTHTRKFPQLLNFAKRVVRKICRSLVEPICLDVSRFNGSVTASINALYNNEIVTEAFIKYQMTLNEKSGQKIYTLENENWEDKLEDKIKQCMDTIRDEFEEQYLNSMEGTLEKLEKNMQIMEKNMLAFEEECIEKIENGKSEVERKIQDIEEENIDTNEKVASINTKLEDKEKEIIQLSDKCNDMSEMLSKLKEQLTCNEDNIVDLKKVTSELSECLKSTDSQIGQMKKSVENVREDFDTALTETELCFLRKVNENDTSVSISAPADIACCKQGACDAGTDTYSSLDYFEFENHFRGSRSKIKEKQAMYIPYLKSKGRILDLGCGRGEFLELLKENGISATGIDAYGEFVEYCKLKGMSAENGNVPECLSVYGNETFGGIFAGQLVEHISFDALNKLCQEAYRIMIPGGCLIIETPNPTCLSTYMNSFYMDPSHSKPVHPKTLQYVLMKQGFNNIQIIYTEQSKVAYRLPLLSASNVENLEEFNDGINFLSDIIFGSQDYAVVAYK